MGKVEDVNYRHWVNYIGICDGVRVVSMIRSEPIPRNVTVGPCHLKESYPGQAQQCDICDQTGHIAKTCPLRSKCRRYKKEGHYDRDCSENSLNIIERERLVPPPSFH